MADTPPLPVPTHNGSRFANPDTFQFSLPNTFRMIKFVASSLFTMPTPPSEPDLSAMFPLADADETLAAITNPPEGEISLTWIGHASTLVQMCGLNVLTDPIFSSRCSAVQFAGPKRYRPPVPPMAPLLDAIPIHAVLISHNHYDHLDKTSVLAIAEANPDVLFLVPSGLLPWFGSIGLPDVSVVELGWWESALLSPQPPNNNNNNNNESGASSSGHVGGHVQVEVLGEHVDPRAVLSQRDDGGSNNALVVTATAAKHWSGRYVLDKCRSLWCSWAIHGSDGGAFWFGGDTGYNQEGFQAIGHAYGPFDLAAIPIGAYEPRDFMRCQHVNPEEAVLISQDIQATTSVGVHWGTFVLTTEPLDEPPRRVAAALAASSLPPSSFITLLHGESRTFPINSTL